jgi:hypothetical protein
MINQDTAKYKIMMNNDPDFVKLSDIRKSVHVAIVQKLENEKKENIKKYPDKTDYFTAEFQKQLYHQSVLTTE